MGPGIVTIAHLSGLTHRIASHMDIKLSSLVKNIVSYIVIRVQCHRCPSVISIFSSPSVDTATHPSPGGFPWILAINGFTHPIKTREPSMRKHPRESVPWDAHLVSVERHGCLNVLYSTLVFPPIQSLGIVQVLACSQDIVNRTQDSDCLYRCCDYRHKEKEQRNLWWIDKSTDQK